MRRLPNLKSQSGQQIVEAVLIITLLLGVTLTVANFFKNEEVLRKLVSGPWQHLAGMLQNGVWAPPKVGAIQHPSGHIRHIVIQGENPR